MEEKVCTRCGIKKPIGDFYFLKKGGKKMSECKMCNSNRNREYKLNHPEIIKAIQTRFKESENGKLFWETYKNSPERQKTQHKYNTSEKGKLSIKKYNEMGEGKKSKQKYAKSDKGVTAEKNKLQRRKQKYLLDPAYNLLVKLRRRVNHAVHNANTHKCNNTVSCIGCTPAYLKTYIESLFTPDMSWDYVISGDIHIDHIVPCTSFDLTDPAQQKQCFHYTNLQPLWKTTRIINGVEYLGNLNKSSKII